MTTYWTTGKVDALVAVNVVHLSNGGRIASCEREHMTPARLDRWARKNYLGYQVQAHDGGNHVYAVRIWK